MEFSLIPIGSTQIDLDSNSSPLQVFKFELFLAALSKGRILKLWE